jgi:hypothetical protein
MATRRSWSAYPATYRAREVERLADWVAAGESSSVVGLPGCGRSNLLGFLCHRPEVFQSYLLAQISEVVLIPVDLNNLPNNDLSTLYRVILRSFHRICDRFKPELRQKTTMLYLETRAEQDPFLPQSALQELLLLFQAQQIQVVLVFNRFDRFCGMATLQMVNTLRGLRDDFKDTLCYIAGMTQEVAYLPDPASLGDMYELLDNYVCWLGTMNEEDSRNLIARATPTAKPPLSEADIATLLALTGGYPALLRAACHWWLTTVNKPDRSQWTVILLAEHSIQHRLAKIWTGLTQEEQFTLSELQKLQQIDADKRLENFSQQHAHLLSRLAEKGVCCQAERGWRVAGDLLANYVTTIKGRGRGRIWLDEDTAEIYQGQTLLENLTALESAVLSFLIEHPRQRHTKTDIIISSWPDDLRQQGVTDNSLYQVILTLRKTIEPDPSEPSYLVTWRGKPEGGYQFFPEGRPR